MVSPFKITWDVPVSDAAYTPIPTWQPNSEPSVGAVSAMFDTVTFLSSPDPLWKYTPIGSCPQLVKVLCAALPSIVRFLIVTLAPDVTSTIGYGVVEWFGSVSTGLRVVGAMVV